MTTWADVERALSGLPGWRRVGVEWHGPCPVTGAGHDCCWCGPGASTAIRIGCRHCGGRLDAAAVREHLAALGADSGDLAPIRRKPTREDRLSGPNATGRRENPAGDSAHGVGAALGRPLAVWRSGRTPAGTPAALYLAERRRVWPAGEPLPESVRWLPAGECGKLRPRLPDGAAGAVLYRFAPPDGPGVAVQFEAVAADGSRVLVAVGRPGERRTAKRPTVIGSRFDGGMLAFVARPGAAGAVLHLAEGPIDALALVALERLGAGNLGGGAVLGAAGAGGFRPAAVPGAGPVVLWADGDKTGALAAVRLGAALRARGRDVRVRLAPDGDDWADAANLEACERGAIHDGER